MTKPRKRLVDLLLRRSDGGRATVPKQDHSPTVLPRRMKMLAFSLAVLITLVVFELGLRVLWHNPYRHESPDLLLRIRLNHSNIDHIFSRALWDQANTQVRLRTDARSYIRPSFQYSDPDATVAFLGGSTTECLAVQEDLRFPALVSQLLAKQGLKVNTLNAGRSGNTTHDALNILLNHVVDDRPDFVVLMEASNDIGTLARDGDYYGMGPPVSSTDLGKWFLQIASSRVSLAALARTATLSHLLPAPRDPRDPKGNWRYDAALFSKVPANLYRQRLKAFVHICRDFGIQPVLMTQPFSGSTNSLTPGWVDATAQDKFNTIIREVGKEEGVLVIDLVHHLQERVPKWNQPMEVFYDAIHVNDEGSRIYAQHITERLLPLILERSSMKDGRRSPSEHTQDPGP